METPRDGFQDKMDPPTTRWKSSDAIEVDVNFAEPASHQPPAIPEEVLDPEIGLEPPIRRRVIEALQPLLADEIGLYLKTRNFHWNVEGPDFFALHQLFDEQAQALNVVMDNIAERIRALGGYAAGSMQEYLELMRIPEVRGATRSAPDERLELLLLRDHEQLIRELRELTDDFNEWGDVGTQDFVTGLLEGHEKMAWMLRSLVARNNL